MRCRKTSTAARRGHPGVHELQSGRQFSSRQLGRWCRRHCHLPCWFINMGTVLWAAGAHREPGEEGWIYKRSSRLSTGELLLLGSANRDQHSNSGCSPKRTWVQMPSTYVKSQAWLYIRGQRQVAPSSTEACHLGHSSMSTSLKALRQGTIEAQNPALAST